MDITKHVAPTQIPRKGPITLGLMYATFPYIVQNYLTGNLWVCLDLDVTQLTKSCCLHMRHKLASNFGARVLLTRWRENKGDAWIHANARVSKVGLPTRRPSKGPQLTVRFRTLF
jgi:hypothetical protein